MHMNDVPALCHYPSLPNQESFAHPKKAPSLQRKKTLPQEIP
jgi:hypothetical protein